jgi:hypothetical protein
MWMGRGPMNSGSKPTDRDDPPSDEQAEKSPKPLQKVKR